MTDVVTIKCNNVPRDVLHWDDLSEAERKEFDYLENLDNDECQSPDGAFFRYKGQVYDLGEYARVPSDSDVFRDFDGYASDSMFSGTLVRYVNDYKQVIVATYFS